MGRCRYDKLSHIEPALVEIRKFDSIKEPKPGIFYKKGQGFLHFHDNKEDEIWADVKAGENWVEIVIPPKVTKKFLKDFVKTVSEHYQNS